MYLTVILSTFIISVDASIQCFYGIDETAANVHVSNIMITQCSSDFFCYKQEKIDKKSKHYQFAYGCGTIQICSQPTCSIGDDGYRTCCCTSDLCNSASFWQLSHAVIVIFLASSLL